MTAYLLLARDIFPQLIGALGTTLLLWILSMVLGGSLAVFIAIARVYGKGVIYYPATWYVEIIRGTPLLVQLFIIYYGLADVSIVVSAFPAAVIALSLNTAAYQAEYLRGAIQSVRGGQVEAAYALGLNTFQVIRRIVLPQALHIVIPPWSNEAIVMLKSTSLAFMITVPELMATARMIASRNYMHLEVFSYVAVLYVVTVFFFTSILDNIQKRTSIPGLGTAGRGKARL